MAEEKKKEEKELTPQERARLCQDAVQKALQEFNCALIAPPGWRLRDDGTYSLITSVSILPNNP